MKFVFSLLFMGLLLQAAAQHKLEPVFDPKEYGELLSLSFYRSSIADSAERLSKKDPYKMEFQSPEAGFLNRWSLYLRDDNVAVIDMRGTVSQTTSWLANFYAAMIPATGSLQLNDSTVFDYQLAADPKASVHVGWTISLGYLAPAIVKSINAIYRDKKVKEFLLIGHSQGGALATLLRSYLEYEKKKGHVPADLILKTYCSASPKVGDTRYVYDFDYITRGGWAYTIVNAADWVPETPFSIQTLADFHLPNPLINAKDYLRKQKFFVRLAGGMVYNKMERKPRKAQRKMEKYLGHKMYTMAVKKVLPQLKEPKYVHSSNYMRAGIPIILMPDEEYNRLYPYDKDKVFMHHMFQPYYFLLKKIYFTR
ncbi:MAG: lipase family protein [Chitinophagaceae bacterium]|nr:MAG: lipase family protein [Chitinophagaceae bacterium]